MLFKNLVFHRLPADWELSAADFESQLAGRTLKPCGPFDMSSGGWVPVTGGGRLLHTVNRQHMVALGVDEKLLPGSIVRQVAQERADLQGREQGFPVGRKQMRELRARVGDELRARALTRRRTTRAWLDPTSGWFAVDASSIPRAEMVVETLSDTLGTFAPQAVETGRSPRACMAAWLLRAEAPLHFSIDDDLELQSADKAKSTVRYTRHPLDGKEIRGHLAAGKYPTRLGLTWNDRVSFVLTDKLQVKRLEFLEMSKDQTEGDDVDPAEQFDIDFAVMAGELGLLLKDLMLALGNDTSDRAEWPSRSKVA
ncbi:MAG TPA: recombination-associated protein RdgC [Steroidobacteraceae bacterium]|nr:recombination-associated protein RdgC [Steroidobacteraceae bacterium]